MIASCRMCRVIVGVALAALALGVSGHAPSPASGAQSAVRSFETTASSVASRTALPSPHPFNAALYSGRPLYSVNNNKHEVALTFDDGPSGSTLPILRILERNGAHATFFFIGDRATSAPGSAIVDEVFRAGDDVGNHTWTHADLSGLSSNVVDEQMNMAQSELERIDGRFPTFVRPRGGKFDSVGLSEATRLGLILTLWSVDGYDIGLHTTPRMIVRRATTGVRAGSIIDLHDHHPATVAALPAILAQLRRDGLRAVTLSQLLADSTPSMAVPAYFRPSSVAVPTVVSTLATPTPFGAGVASSSPTGSASAESSRVNGSVSAFKPGPSPSDAAATKRSQFWLTISALVAIAGAALAAAIAVTILVLHLRNR